MKIIVHIKPENDEYGNEMVSIKTSHKGKRKTMAVRRTEARVLRAIIEELNRIKSESRFIGKRYYKYGKESEEE